MNDRRQSLDQLLEFPASFTFRVVAEERADLCQCCTQVVEGILGRPIERVVEQPSKSGRYRTVRLTVIVQDGQEVTRSYEALQGLAGVRMLL